MPRRVSSGGGGREKHLQTASCDDIPRPYSRPEEHRSLKGGGN